MFGWKNNTALAVVLFGGLLWYMLAVEKARADGIYIGLGQTVFNSSLTAPELGYELGKYRFSIGATGGSSVKPIVSAYRVVDPGWGWLRAGIGVAHTPDQPLVGDVNYRLELMLVLPADAELYATHYSSAGTFDNNTGLDLIGFRLRF
jgi:hypothetical protein